MNITIHFAKVLFQFKFNTSILNFDLVFSMNSMRAEKKMAARKYVDFHNGS